MTDTKIDELRKSSKRLKLSRTQLTKLIMKDRGIGYNRAAMLLDYIIENETKQLITEEVKLISDKLDELHQGTPGAGYVHYGELGEYLDERLAALQGK